MSSVAAPSLVENIKDDARLHLVFDSLRGRLLARMKAGALELPLLPRVAMDVLRMTTSESSSAEELAEVLHRDQSMTAHVLRVVNSPLYRTRSPIDSLPQALNRLGFGMIREIAMVIACKQRVFRARDFGPEVYRSFRHSLGTALFAQEIARAIHVDAEEAFLAGLLHDIGRPVLLQAVADLHAESRLVDTPAVMAVVAELHAQVGELLARKNGICRHAFAMRSRFITIRFRANRARRLVARQSRRRSVGACRRSETCSRDDALDAHAFEHFDRDFRGRARATPAAFADDGRASLVTNSRCGEIRKAR